MQWQTCNAPAAMLLALMTLLAGLLCCHLPGAAVELPFNILPPWLEFLAVQDDAIVDKLKSWTDHLMARRFK